MKNLYLFFREQRLLALVITTIALIYSISLTQKSTLTGAELFYNYVRETLATFLAIGTSLIASLSWLASVLTVGVVSMDSAGFVALGMLLLFIFFIKRKKFKIAYVTLKEEKCFGLLLVIKQILRWMSIFVVYPFIVIVVSRLILTTYSNFGPKLIGGTVTLTAIVSAISSFLALYDKLTDNKE